jgi:ABC-2 type transport system permease protein
MTPPPSSVASSSAAGSAPEVRRFGAVNWVGLWTLYLKEVRRFTKVATQTILAPLVTTLLFFAIFTLALGRAVQNVGGVSFPEFLGPGLIMMAMVQNAFANTSSSLVIAKIQGNIVDLVMPPLSPGELTFALAAGGLTRGLAVGITVGIVIALLVPVHIHDLFFVLFHAIAASLLLSLLGILGGLWSEKFDHIAAVTNFVITPLSFLSGAFYSTERLPGVWHTVAHFNPFFYMIDGFRYGFIGHADGSVIAGLAALIFANIGLYALIHRLFAIGYKLRP